MVTQAGERKRLLILSDGKPGHVNQSVAFARLLGHDFTICRVALVSRFAKACTYLLDRINLYLGFPYRIADPLPQGVSAVVSAGSATYYANRVIGRTLGVPSIAIMYPGGYSPAFDLIIAQAHDAPPRRDNILTVPVNLSSPVPQGLVEKREGVTTVAVIIGGPSRHFAMDGQQVRDQLERLYSLFPGADFLATTSRRTPAGVERMIVDGPFRYRVIASREQVNPIADFLAVADYVFVTEDSTSMISEAVSFGSARVEVLPLAGTGVRNKVQGMVASLADGGYLHIFDGTVGDCNRKFDLKSLLEGRFPCA